MGLPFPVVDPVFPLREGAPTLDAVTFRKKTHYKLGPTLHPHGFANVYLSTYLNYIAPLHRFLHRIRSTLQYSFVQGLSVFHSFMRRSHLLPDQLPGGAYRCHGSCVHISASARQPGETHNAVFSLHHTKSIFILLGDTVRGMSRQCC